MVIIPPLRVTKDVYASHHNGLQSKVYDNDKAAGTSFTFIACEMSNRPAQPHSHPAELNCETETPRED